MQEWTYSPTAVTVPQLMLDPYRCGFDAHTALSEAEAQGQWGDEDWRVPPQARTEEQAPWTAPEPGPRPPLALAPADRRRLELHAALVRAGVAPAPGDLHAVAVLSTLDDTVNDAVRRWIAAY
ncbi:hypothetical protein [Streptomyces phaeoluteigriseus]|uniref:hypothetical protein n=1 Tax=Streptomyces phaeoluteigriseus TaxID=114686 RepID=UPI003679905E